MKNNPTSNDDQMDSVRQQLSDLAESIRQLSGKVDSGALVTYCSMCCYSSGEPPYVKCTAVTRNTCSNPEHPYSHNINTNGFCPHYKPLGVNAKQKAIVETPVCVKKHWWNW